MRPVNNPSIPYRGVLPIQPGNASSVTIAGAIPNQCNRFQFNFETQTGNRAFHFNPRFEGANVVVRNTRINGNWGTQESNQPGFPFKKGATFVVKIILGNNQYRVSVNGADFCNYKHRISKEEVKHLTIEGDVKVTEIRYDNGRNQQTSPMPKPPAYTEKPSPMKGGCIPPAMKAGCIPPGLMPGQVPAYAPGLAPMYNNPAMGYAPAAGYGVPLGAQPPPMVVYNPVGPPPPPVYAAPMPQPGVSDLFGGLRLSEGSGDANFQYSRTVTVTTEQRMGNEHSGPMASAPIFNPSLPYRGFLPMAPGHGASVIINGVIPSHCNRFQFNLETDSRDVAMHFNPRFEGMNAVIRNTCQQGSWGSEEKHGYFPFHKGSPFEVTIKIEEHHYKISINHQDFCNYNHRIPKDYVRQLTIEGDVQISQIRFQAGSAAPIYNPPMPVNAHIPGGLHPGKMVRVTGQSSYNPSRFNVNLVHGSGFHSNADIGLHCDVRYNYGDSRNIVVRTHRQNGGWGQEERHASFFPFVPGQPFEMIIRAEHDKYMIAVNNQHMFEFNHRMHPMNRFDHLYIEGDVNISMVQFQ